eukprot:GSMAST32.ASY1.ANO1.506.1 assembled CDS
MIFFEIFFQNTCLTCDLNMSEEYCTICYVDALGNAPTIQLKCGHLFHAACVRDLLEKGYPGHRMSFEFMKCPQCKEQIRHWSVEDIVGPMIALEADVHRRALLRFKMEGLDKDAAVIKPGGDFYQKPLQFALHEFVFYQCYKCKRPYFGGNYRCGAADEDEEDEDDVAKDLLCPSCAVDNVEECPKHGKDWIAHKCRFCCSVASFCCWGNTHFCVNCHKPGVWKTLAKYKTGKNVKKLSSGLNTNTSYAKDNDDEEYVACPGIQHNDPLLCPLRCRHPPNGIEFGLGCTLCNDERQKNMDEARRVEDKRNKDILEFLDRMRHPAFVGSTKDALMRPRGVKLLQMYANFHRKEGRQRATAKAIQRTDMLCFLLRCAPMAWLAQHNFTEDEIARQQQLTSWNLSTRRKERKRITDSYFKFLQQNGENISVARGLSINGDAALGVQPEEIAMESKVK